MEIGNGGKPSRHSRFKTKTFPGRIWCVGFFGGSVDNVDGQWGIISCHVAYNRTLARIWVSL